MGNFIYQKEAQIGGYPDSLSPEQMELALFQMKNCICKIKIENGFGTGFLCKIPFPDSLSLLPALITCNHVLNDDNISIGNKINLSFNNEAVFYSILISNSRKTYTDKEKDITIIEINPKNDKIKLESFLDIDENIFKENLNNQYKNKSIYILHYEKGKNAKYSIGTIKKISEDKNEISHVCSTRTGSSGSPIINLFNFKVIGVHKGGYSKIINLGTLLKVPIKNFYSKITTINKIGIDVQIVCQSSEFNNLDLEKFKTKFKSIQNFEELMLLKEIQIDILREFKFTIRQLDERGNKISIWSIGEYRGNKPYDPPLGWLGIGLRVINRYEDNIWIGNNNTNGEWCVAYHGVAKGQSSDNVKRIVRNIYQSYFRPGQNQVHSNCNDIFHPGKKVGIGVCFTPLIKIAENYAGMANINGIMYKIVLMVRINPDAIRACEDAKDYWFVDGTTDMVRPYRILFKRCDDY